LILVAHDKGLDAPPTTTTAHSFPDLQPSEPLPIIIRATDGKSKEQKAQKIKFSTIVEADALDAFFFKYAEVCKLGMSGLKKRDRSKGKKKKAKKKKGGAVASGMDEARKS
jgi:signal recognition particle subunit SRP14